jgi:hypothetical protein
MDVKQFDFKSRIFVSYHVKLGHCNEDFAVRAYGNIFNLKLVSVQMYSDVFSRT